MPDDDLTPEDIAAAAERRRELDEIMRDIDELDERGRRLHRLPDDEPPHLGEFVH
jgi:hypothetical protein